MILGIALALTLKDIAWLAGDWQLTTPDAVHRGSSGRRRPPTCWSA